MCQNDNQLKYDHILVRYGELTTKGKNRNDFIKRLIQNIKRSLRDFSTLRYEKTHDRLYILLGQEKAEEVGEVLKDIFGISSFSYALKVPSELETIVVEATKLLTKEKGSTFKVVTKRANKHFLHRSDEVNRHVASSILQTTPWKVNVHEPDIYLRVEIREDYTYIMCNKIQGAGGYPVGIGGKAMLLLSGGIDSPVAGYLTQKRGILVECIHFASPPYTSQSSREKVLELASSLTKNQGHVRVHIINFTELQLAIYQHCSESYAITMMRRMMVRLAERLSKKQNALALVTGESVGQVASQTLESISVINEVTHMPILRPVITMDKLEIIDVAKKIGTYETSIQPFEDCCTIFTPKNPVTKPSLKKALQLEEGFDFEELLEKCGETVESVDVYVEKKESNEYF